MNFKNVLPKFFLLGCLLSLSSLLKPSMAQTPGPPKYPDYPSETPINLVSSSTGFGYEKRDVMIPMRDGVKLHTVIIVPKGAKDAGILFTRTPYSASGNFGQNASPHLGTSLEHGDSPVELIVEDGYIRVFQDVRGKYGSEGDYVMTRPLHGPLNPTPVDHSTDTYDTIDWLVKNLPESNGRVGIIGISYDGFLPLMALINPHPALKVSVPMNPMVDGWKGDDWFHNGAFRQQMMPYIYEQQATRGGDAKWWYSHYDDYDNFLEAGSAGEIGKQHGLEQVGYWRRILEHPAYDSFWQLQAMDQILAAQPLKVPVMLVDSLWDQEDIYGATAVYKAIKPKDTGNNMVYMVLGPWHHGQEIGDASTLGAVKFHTDTGLYFRQEILRPFLAQYLKTGAPKADVSTISAYETGTNKWLKLANWPAGCASGCTVKPTPLYLESGQKLSFTSPKSSDAPFAEYVSDPAKPVPYRARPIHPMDSSASTWSRWLVDDQREASGRPDVLSFLSPVLTDPVKISGQPIANLVASTSGTDSDWVVKLIDVYPDEVTMDASMGGFQLMVSGDIFRGRYRESLETPGPIASDKPLLYRFALPNANHVFLPGHRIMVQVQSSWFPLYDRNPQSFVPSIFWAKPEDYKKATQRIFHSTTEQSLVELPLVVKP
jgi:uncharacterized protein